MPVGTGTVMALSALVLGALGIGNLQGTPAADAKAPLAPVIAQADATMQRRVSGKFENASLGEVLRWLGGQGVSFVADSSQLAGDSKLTMNIENQPLSDVTDAIAGAFNGRWEKHGNVYTFKRGYAGIPAPETPTFEMPEGNLKFFAPDMKELKDLTPEIQKSIEEAMKGLKIQGDLGEGGLFLFPDMKQLTPEQKKEVEAAMKELKAKLLLDKDGKTFKFEMPDMKEQEKAMKELELRMKDSKMKGFLDKDGKTFKFEMPDMKELQKLKELKGFEGAPFVKLQSGNVTKLIDSLSNEQRAKQTKQGYLTPSDLTKEQRAMLGDLPSGGDWTISYSINGKKLTIKGK